MPPKRGRPPRSQPEQQAARTSPSTKRAKRKTTSQGSDHTAHSDAEILEAFRLFAVPGDDKDEDDDEEDDDQGVLRVVDVRRCLSALNLPKPPSDFFEPSQTHISASEFLLLAQTMYSSSYSSYNQNTEDHTISTEISHAFALFTHTSAPASSSSINSKRVITLSDLKRVARELREEVDEKLLRLMIEEANGGRGREAVGKGVSRGEFEGVMRRAGVFG